MEIEGRIVRKLAVQSGTSARGAWSKQEFILEFQEGNFPAQVCMNVWGEDKVRELDKYQVGDKVKASFNLSSREFNGRWYTDVRAWRIEPAGQASYQNQVDSVPPPSAPVPPTLDDMSSPLEEDDLPF